MASPSLATQYAPSLRLVSAHFALGILGFVGFSCALMLRASTVSGHFFQPQILGLVHLCVLGWLLPITLGALHQLVPVVFEAKVRSERLPWVALALYAAGASGFVAHLWAFAFGLGFVIAAGLLVLSLYLYLGNLVVTLLHGGARTLTGAFVLSAFWYLALAAGLGFALALHLHAPYLSIDHLRLLRVHVHAAGLGFFGLLIMGVSFRLLEMFLIAYVKREDAGWLALVAIHVSLASLTAHHMLTPSDASLRVALVAAVVGVGAFLVQVRRLYRARLRRRTDLPWRHTAASFSYLAVASVLGCVIGTTNLDAHTQERLQLAYGFLALPGFIGSVIVGQLHKILPFLVWFHRYSRYVGLRTVPTASELLPEPPQRVQWFLMHGGIVAATAGLVLGEPPLLLAGTGAFMASSLVFARNMWVVYRSQP